MKKKCNLTFYWEKYKNEGRDKEYGKRMRILESTPDTARSTPWKETKRKEKGGERRNGKGSRH